MHISLACSWSPSFTLSMNWRHELKRRISRDRLKYFFLKTTWIRLLFLLSLQSFRKSLVILSFLSPCHVLLLLLSLHVFCIVMNEENLLRLSILHDPWSKERGYPLLLSDIKEHDTVREGKLYVLFLSLLHYWSPFHCLYYNSLLDWIQSGCCTNRNIVTFIWLHLIVDHNQHLIRDKSDVHLLLMLVSQKKFLHFMSYD